MTSPDWKTVPIFGTYMRLDGSPDTGIVRLSFTARVCSTTGDVIVSARSVVEAELDADGHVSIDVPATDDPDNTPSDWSIQVEEKLSSGGGERYFIRPTLAMRPDGLNLRTVLTPSAPEVSPALTVGGPGGLARLSPDGSTVLGANGEPITAALPLLVDLGGPNDSPGA